MLPNCKPAIPAGIRRPMLAGVIAMLTVAPLTPPAAAQGFISPGARALTPAGRPGPTAPQPAAPLTPPSPPGAALPSLRLPTAAAVPAEPPATDNEAPAPVQRAALPPARPVPPPPAFPPAEAAAKLRVMIDGAWSRSPELGGSAARQAVAAARGRSADSLTPNPSVLGGGFIADGFNNRRGGREGELSIATPLWLPGEGAASRRAADADLSRLTAQQQAQRLAVAGEVREALAAVALGQLELAGAEARLRDARALEADVGRRVRGRDAAETELLTTRLDRMEAEIGLGERRAALDGARLAFRSLTGTEPDPAALNESDPPPPSSAALPAHPRILEADGVVASATASRRLASIQVRESPEIGLLARSTRSAGENRYDNEAGFQFRLPLSTQARNAPRQSAAEAELTDAVVAAANVRRLVDLQAARARIELDSVARALGIARMRASVLRQQRGLAEAAFRGGQFGIADVIRVRVLATEAEIAQGRADIAVRQARSRVHQALGLLP